MTYPEQQPWFPEEQRLAEEAQVLFTESLAGQYRALIPFVSAENIKKYSFRIGEFAKSFVEQYPSQDSSRLSLFSDMLEVSCQPPEQNGSFFLATNVRDEECCSQIIVDPLCRIVPEDDQMVILRIIVQESLAAIARQLQATIQRIREGTDEDGDVVFLKVLGGRADIIKAFHDYLLLSQPGAPAFRIRDVNNGVLAEVLKCVSDSKEQLQVPAAMGNRIELVSTAVTNAVLGLHSQFFITLEEMSKANVVVGAGVHLPGNGDDRGYTRVVVEKKQEEDVRENFLDDVTVMDGLSMNDRLLPGVLVGHLRQLFEQLDTHDLWGWSDCG